MSNLKTLITICAFLSCLSGELQAQEYEEGKFYIHLGVGLHGNPSYEEGHQMQIPLLTVDVEKAVTDKITVGGRLGYTSSRGTVYRFRGDHYFYRHQYAVAMVRSAWHQSLFNQEKFDFYVGLGLGIKVAKYGYQGRGDLTNLNVNTVTTPSGFVYSVFVGGHYYHSDFLHLFLEGGLGISLLSVGIQFSL